MHFKLKFWSLVLLSLFGLKCASQDSQKNGVRTENETPVTLLTGADRLAYYLPLLTNTNLGLVVNQTSRINDTHLVDTFLALNLKVIKMYSPEHGIRGVASRGEKIEDGKDPKTGIPIVSLYGENRKPTTSNLSGIDYMIFDIQDVGARFYTYISTLTLVMEACAENKIPLLILDRPNPNGHYVDGPLMTPQYTSFVGMHKVPIVHGMTIGEYALMVKGEGWLKNEMNCAVEVIPCSGYDHNTVYDLPVKPSPNLPNLRSIYLYPALCLFEGTKVSIGRGTQKQFQVLGYPEFQKGEFEFTPVSQEGAKNPLYEGMVCKGIDLSEKPEDFYRKDFLDLSLLKWFFDNSSEQSDFFNSNLWIDKLSGSNNLRKQIEAGVPLEQIYASWQDDLKDFKKIRKKYLLYKDFE